MDTTISRNGVLNTSANPTTTIVRRSESPPPPYQSRETREATPDWNHVVGLVVGSDWQEPPRLDDPSNDALEARAMILEGSTPHEQFLQQVRRIKEQMTHQRDNMQARRQTHAYDETQDLVINAENTVRARWVKQKIWKPTWGPAWPTNAKRGWRQDIRHSKKGPWVPERARWGHEVELDADDKPARGDVDVDASRPFHQFKYQVKCEQEWLKDEPDYRDQSPTSAKDLERKARDTIKAEWTDLEIWNPEWAEFPGMSWMHADQLDTLWGIIQPPAPAPDNTDAVSKEYQGISDVELPHTEPEKSVTATAASEAAPEPGEALPDPIGGQSETEIDTTQRISASAKAPGKGKRRIAAGPKIERATPSLEATSVLINETERGPRRSTRITTSTDSANATTLPKPSSNPKRKLAQPSDTSSANSSKTQKSNKTAKQQRR